MQKIKIFQVDAFTDHLFGGNPAAVCLLDQWLPTELMQSIAAENNLAETAFVVRSGDSYHIRWFTPAVEVELCGHATLASGYVLFNHDGFTGKDILFHSRFSGELKVRKEGRKLFLDFPADDVTPCNSHDAIARGIGIRPLQTFRGKTDFMAVLGSEEEVCNVCPDLAEIAKLDARGLVITASGNHVDFVSRFFAPQSGIDEDPVTGSAHTTLIPYWAARLDKNEMTAMQVSKRTGSLECRYLPPRVIIGGEAQLYLSGEIFV